MSTLDLAIAPELAGHVRLGVLVLEGVSVREADPALAAEVDAQCAALRARHAGASSGAVPGVEEARGLYKALGIDPTKTRPSNEALMRRALKGEALYRVNTLVDALNLASLRLQLPFGLYDLARVEPPVTLRRGGPGESYEGIRKGPVNVEGRPALVDARGPFGNPTSDSARTCIRLDTTRALVVAYAPAGCSDRRLGEVLDATEALLLRYCGGTPAQRHLVPSPRSQ
jgi:DNA/RNA-binding domain of Phe-tRNA-synthetase-like protein